MAASFDVGRCRAAIHRLHRAGYYYPTLPCRASLAGVLFEKPMFRSAFKRNRCIIPASGYSQWKTTKARKQPYYFTPTEGPILSIAGIWDEWDRPGNRQASKVLHNDDYRAE